LEKGKPQIFIPWSSTFFSITLLTINPPTYSYTPKTIGNQHGVINQLRSQPSPKPTHRNITDWRRNGGGHFPVVITHHLLQQLLQHPLSRLLLHQQQQQLLPNILALVLQREFGDGVQLRTKQIVLQDVTAAAGTVGVAEHEV
jgi:hypothetical protein